MELPRGPIESWEESLEFPLHRQVFFFYPLWFLCPALNALAICELIFLSLPQEKREAREADNRAVWHNEKMERGGGPCNRRLLQGPEDTDTKTRQTKLYSEKQVSNHH